VIQWNTQWHTRQRMRKQEHLTRLEQQRLLEAQRDLSWLKEYQNMVKNFLLEQDTNNALDHEYKTNLPKQRLSRDSQHRSWDGYNWTIV